MEIKRFLFILFILLTSLSYSQTGQKYYNTRGVHRIVIDGDTCDMYVDGDSAIIKSTTQTIFKFKGFSTLLFGTDTITPIQINCLNQDCDSADIIFNNTQDTVKIRAYTETDPIYSTSVASEITASDTSDYRTASDSTHWHSNKQLLDEIEPSDTTRWGSSSGGGEVDTTGLPVANQVAYFTAANKIGGSPNLIYSNDSLLHKNAEYNFFGDFNEYDNYIELYYNDASPYFNFENSSTSGNTTLSMTPTNSYIRSRNVNNYGSIVYLYHDSLVNISTYVTGQTRTKLDSTGFIMKNETDSVFRFKLSGSKINSGLDINGDITSDIINTSGTISTHGYFDNGTTNPTSTANRINANLSLWASQFLSNTTSRNISLTTSSTSVYSTEISGGADISSGLGTTKNALYLDNFLNGSSTRTGSILKIENTVTGSVNNTGHILEIVDNPTTSGTTTGKVLSATIGATERTVINPRVNGLTAHLWGTHSPLTGEKHTVFMNQSDTLAYIDSIKLKSFEYMEADSFISLTQVYADYVFEEDYKVPSLFSDVKYTKENKTLPKLTNKNGNISRRLENAIESIERLYLQVYREFKTIYLIIFIILVWNIILTYKLFKKKS